MVLGTIDIIIPNGVLLCISKKRQTLMDEFVFPSLIIIMTKLKNVPARKQWRLLAGLMNYYDVTAYINSYPSDSVQRKILSMYFYQDKSDAQIARKLKLSRQYVNRMKKKLILRYISENK